MVRPFQYTFKLICFSQDMPTGDIEVVAVQFEILNHSKENLPFQVHDFSKVRFVNRKHSNKGFLRKNIDFSWTKDVGIYNT